MTVRRYQQLLDRELWLLLSSSLEVYASVDNSVRTISGVK